MTLFARLSFGLGLVCGAQSLVRALPTPARVRVPVADLLYTPAQTYGSGSVTTIYQNLGLGDANCQRAYQLLLHEPVLIVAEQGVEVQVAVPQVVYLTDSRCAGSVSPQLTNCDQSAPNYTNYFWTLRANLITEAELTAQGIDLTHLPQPIDYRTGDLAACNQQTVTLTQPVFSPALQQTLSAGTRLVLVAPAENAAPGTVWCYHDQTQCLIQLQLPAHSYTIYQAQSMIERRQAFVGLLRQWAQPANGFIPYVYGGASFTQLATLPANQTYLSTNLDGSTLYQRENYLAAPQTGYDCSCLISRAAQIAGIPYFYKNSATAARNLPAITELSQLQNGDLLWHTGHIMVVSDVERGLLIEARGYRQGFGCVHEIPLSRIYVGIQTYADLWQAMQTKTVVKTLDDQGRPFGAIQQFKFLKLVLAQPVTLV